MALPIKRGLRALHNLDYTIIFARDLDALRKFYRDILGFAVHREMGESWTEFRIGGTILALTRRGALDAALEHDHRPHHTRLCQRKDSNAGSSGASVRILV